MCSVWRRLVTPIIICRNLRSGLKVKPLHNLSTANINPTLYNLPSRIPYNSIRFKSKKQTDLDSDDEAIFDDDYSLARDSKVAKFSTTSMRLDMILKSALGVPRNKIEQVFYDSRIRLNGKKVLKKSVSVKLGDEIDVIKSVSSKNPDHLNISRVEILNVTAKEESIAVTARRFKSLLIENYEIDPFKGNADSEN